MEKVSLNNNINDIVSNLTDDLVNDLTKSNPTVTTDKDDYAPGETAQITGSGFTPGSEVVIQIVDDPADSGDDEDVDVYQPITIIADEFGSFSSTWFVPIDNNGTGSGIPDALNATLFLTATGTGIDGVLGTGDDQLATTTFTDGGRPGSNNSGTSGSSSQNAGSIIEAEVSITLFSDIQDTNSNPNIGFFPGAVGSFTRVVSQDGQILPNGAVDAEGNFIPGGFDFANLDLLVESISSDLISYTFLDENGSPVIEANSSPTANGSFFLTSFGTFSAEELINDLTIIAENLFNLGVESDPDPSNPEIGDFFPGFDSNDSVSVSSNVVVIPDTIPVATNNIASVTEDSSTTYSGNLITDDDGFGADSDSAGDPLSVSEIDGVTNPNTDITGDFGSLNWDTDGSYTYTLNNDNSTVQSLGVEEILTDTFTYTLIDDEGGRDTANLTVTINGNNDNPVAADDSDIITFSNDFTTDEDTPFITGNVLNNDSDRDTSDILSIISIDTNAFNTKGTVTINGDGTFNYDPNGQFEFLREDFFDRLTTDRFNYTVSDGNGGTATATVEITILGIDTPPTAGDDTGTGFITDEETAFDTATVLTNDSDPDSSSSLLITGLNTSETLGLVTANFDNSEDEGAPFYGTYSYDPNGQFEFLGVGETAIDTFSYTIASPDSSGRQQRDTATVSITINGTNDAPTANNDSNIGFITDEDTAFTTASVLLNDTDPDTNDTLGILSFDTSGTRGTVTSNRNGTFAYDPNGAFEDLNDGDTYIDSFSYTISDGNGGTGTGTVNITINGVTDNNPPNAVNDNFTTDEDTLLTAISILGNDNDPDSDPLMVTQVNGIANVGTEIMLTSGALLTLNSDGTFDYDTNGFFSYLAAGETATDTFSYTISDGELTDTADVIVNVEGPSDLFNSGTPFSFSQGTNGGSNTFGFNGDAFFISGQGVSGRPKFQDFDDFLVKAAEVFDGVVERRGTINDQRLPSGDGPNNINVNANDEVTIGGQGIGGSYKIQFGNTTEAETFRDFVVRMFDEIDGNDAIANDPKDFRFDALTGAARLFFDDINNEFGFTTDGGETQTRFNNLEEFVEGIAGDIFGSIQLRDGSFNAERIAGGKTPSKIRVIGGDDVVIGGQSVGGQFMFDFADAAIAGSFRDIASELFSNIDEANAIAFGDL